MDMYRAFLCFVIYAFVGWLYESSYYTLRHRKPVNTGFLNGCICPIYGLGALLDIAILGRIENTMYLFIAGMVLTCTLEYIISWVLEEVFHKRWWDYSSWPFNIHGRVCLLGGLAFGTLTVFLMRILHPRVMGYLMSMDMRTIQFACLLASLLILADLVVTVKNMDNNSEKLWFVDQSEKFFAASDNKFARQRRIVVDKIRAIPLRSPRISGFIKRIMDYINRR